MWELFRPVLPPDSPLHNATQPPQLEIDEATLRHLHRQHDSEFLSCYIADHVLSIYENYRLFKELRSAILHRVEQLLADDRRAAEAAAEAHQAFETERDKMHQAFGDGYVGDADARFQRHLVRCCQAYRGRPDAYTAPCVALVQASGFGKSRLLYQLATKLAGPQPESTSDDVVIEEEAFDLRLLYVCARTVRNSTGFPVATPKLAKFLFQDHGCDMAGRLRMVLDYACAHWASVQTPWLGLFGTRVPADVAAEDALVAALKAHEEEEEVAGPQDPNPNPNPRVRVLVLAIDEARCLADWMGDDDALGRLHRALQQANRHLRPTNRMLLAVVVDTSPRILRVTRAHRGTRRFVPFVLTHTMDVLLQGGGSGPSFDYKASVLDAGDDDPDQAWTSLVAMGRPLWGSNYAYNKATVGCGWARDRVRFMASAKLLCGLNPEDDESYRSRTTLHGIAALLCRLGLGVRPSATALASEVVGDYLAVLHHVSAGSPATAAAGMPSLVCGYVSEPVVAFAATHMWYFQYCKRWHDDRTRQHALQAAMLPQLQQLLAEGLLEVGNGGGGGEGLAARIVLLLAMDATIQASAPEGAVFGPSYGSHRFQGQFCSVLRFLGLLDGSHVRTRCVEGKRAAQSDVEATSDPLVHPVLLLTARTHATTPSVASPAHQARFADWKREWQHWRVGFSHFVELTAQPTDATLWFLLGRRAAGVLPPKDEQEGEAPALIVPVFCRRTREASFLLVHVGEDDAADGLQPATSGVFADDDILSPRERLRIVLSLNRSERRQQQSTASYRMADVADGAHGYALWLGGVLGGGDAEEQEEGVAAAVTLWPFLLSPGMAQQLATLARPV